MAFFKKIMNSIKNAFCADIGDACDESEVTKQRNVISDYQQATQMKPTIQEQVQTSQAAAQTQSIPTGEVTTQLKSPFVAHTPKTKQLTEVSEVVEYQVTSRIEQTQLDILVDALGMNKKKITLDRGVVSFPFDASGCDFETKWQLSHAAATEFQIVNSSLPNGMACAEAAKRVFSAIKATREECFVCGSLFIAINQDIDDEGFMVAEITNIRNGNTVFFDIPAAVSNAGTVDIDYELITTNIMISKERLA